MKVKELRKSLRNVVQELLPNLILQELEKALYKNLEYKIKLMDEHVRQELHAMTERQKDTLSYLVRQVSSTKQDK